MPVVVGGLLAQLISRVLTWRAPHPSAAAALWAFVAVAAGLGIRFRPAAVNPGVPGLDRPERCVLPSVEQLTVVTDHDDGLGGLPEPLLQPLLAGTSGVVVGSSSSNTSSGPRSSASSTNRFCSPPDRVFTRRHRQDSARHQLTNDTASVEDFGVVAACVASRRARWRSGAGWAGSSSRSIRASSAARRHRPQPRADRRWRQTAAVRGPMWNHGCRR